MREERLKILSMVEEKKITVEEAERLFDALYVSRRLAFEQSAGEFAGSVSRAAKNAAEFISDGVKTVTPKIIEVTKTVVAKTAEAAEGISKQVREWGESRPSDGQCGCGCEEDAAANDDGDEKHEDEPREN